MIFELEVPPRAPLTVRVDGREERFTLAQAMAACRIMPFIDEIKALIEQRFRLTPDDIEGRDVFWCAAYKAKIHTAIPEAGYTAQREWIDEDAPPGRNWYYVRVSQLNGQIAWSSPIWVEG
jgi:hypothetical protein